MPSKLNSMLTTALICSLGIAGQSFTYASETSKLTKEKQAELNRLLAEAAKQAGIELDDEELTIVIVKKPGKETDSSDTNDEGNVIGDVTTEGSSQTTAASEKSGEEDKVSDEQLVSKNTTTSTTDTNKEEQSLANPDSKQTEPSKENQKAVAATKIGNDTTTQTTNTTEVPRTESIKEQSAATKEPVEVTQSNVPTLSETPQEIKPEAQIENQVSEDNQASEKAVATSTVPTTTAAEEKSHPVNTVNQEFSSAPAIADQSKAIESQADNTTPGLITTAPSAEKTAQANLPVETPVQANPVTNHYYGNYISPERQMDSYYSSDIMEAINKVNTTTSDSLDIPADQIASINLARMESNEMSDLVVEGALDATAAGGVSTTTLKTVVVVPDTSEIDDMDKELEDEDIEELKEALNKKDLNKRVKEALEQLSRNQNRGSSSSNNIGTMNASGVNVTATLSSRITTNSVSTFNQTNLRNTNF
ncbi:hypothetical protein [Litoribrevibacter albus]|uniref:Uncharacterized protein n=1 Tax=Litoribrevibacter albus TaxID=1473156 RepID=A0AA37S9N5_9GAMM|nr:hypothetical protein [Litoribrevibacter albus]GLQ30961.1 hypothetical protein GCM10007876_14400 [Litoribrevibacter albus]